MRILVASALLLLSADAGAEPVFTGRVSLTALLYTETDGIGADGTDMAVLTTRDKLATTAILGYAELRGLLEGKRLWRDRLDVRLDLRLRATGNFDFERKFNNQSADLPTQLAQNPALSLGVSSRGYLGGPEYDLREAYGLLRATDRVTVQVGRMYVREGNTIKIDGARLLRRFGASWEGGAFVGGYPNPYSRSLLSDYQLPCGAGVAGSATLTVQESAVVDGNGVTTVPCVGEGPQLSLGLGLTARYDYSRLWGAIGLVGTIFGGVGDGGPVLVLAQPDVTTLNTLSPPNGALDAPRIFVSWLNAWRPLEKLDLFSDLVFDFYGSAGPQLTRAVALGTLRLLRDNRLTLRLGYSHLSSLAINMFLNRLLYNRRSGAALSLSQLGLVENNLTVLRTGRDEVRATADARLRGRLSGFIDGRFRVRYLGGGDSVPDADDAGLFTKDAQNLAGDVSLGVRDQGSFRQIRAGLSYTALFNFRAQNHVISLDLGRDFLGERLSVDFQYLFAYTADGGGSDKAMEQTCASTDPYLQVCYGRRRGTTHEIGLTLTANPGRRLFFLLDYRLIALLTNQQDAGATTIPTVISNGVLLRGEYRW